MKSIKLGFFTVLEFEESNTNYDCIRQIMQAKDRQIIGQTDFDIICSMFELHKKLPPVAKVLYDNGFVLPKTKLCPAIHMMLSGNMNSKMSRLRSLSIQTNITKQKIINQIAITNSLNIELVIF